MPNTLRASICSAPALGATPSAWSDIDVAVEPLEPLPGDLLSNIAEDLDESTVPYYVDVVDLTTARPEFREEVKREGIEWTR